MQFRWSQNKCTNSEEILPSNTISDYKTYMSWIASNHFTNNPSKWRYLSWRQHHKMFRNTSLFYNSNFWHEDSQKILYMSVSLLLCLCPNSSHHTLPCIAVPCLTCSHSFSPNFPGKNLLF